MNRRVPPPYDVVFDVKPDRNGFRNKNRNNYFCHASVLCLFYFCFISVFFCYMVLYGFIWPKVKTNYMVNVSKQRKTPSQLTSLPIKQFLFYPYKPI